MNRYETVFIASSVLSDIESAELFSKFQGIIAENGGTVEFSEQWGLKKLAYPIQKKSTGYYFLMEFTSETGEIVEKLEMIYRRDEKVIRFLTFSLDKHAEAWAGRRRDKMNTKNNEQNQ